MGEELIPYSKNDNTVIENATRFQNFLSSDAVSPIRGALSIIPNCVKNALDFALKRKELSIQEKKSKQEFQLSLRQAELQSQENRRQYSLAIERVRMEANAKMAEIDYRRETTLARINEETRARMQEIKAYERMKLAEIHAQYEIERQKLDDEQRRFLLALKESNRRFLARMEMTKKAQTELTLLINVLTKKIATNRAKKYDYKLLESLSRMKMKSMNEAFDLSEALMDWLGGR
ncbi:MAG: hypothetical protein IKN96_08435 [Oscillibacter sp.]|nr:hypothetical protein [Oscillibacter sp.]